MRSGLFEAFNTPQFAHLNMTVPNNFDPRTLVAWAVKEKPYFSPGKGYHYSNTNYLILGLIIEEITKDSVGDQIRKRLLEPFGLTQTSYPQTEAMPDPWAHGYGLDQAAHEARMAHDPIHRTQAAAMTVIPVLSLLVAALAVFVGPVMARSKTTTCNYS